MSKTTKRNPDHVKRHNTPTINNEVIAQHLQDLLTPAISAQQKYYKQLGLRDPSGSPVALCRGTRPPHWLTVSLIYL